MTGGLDTWTWDAEAELGGAGVVLAELESEAVCPSTW